MADSIASYGNEALNVSRIAPSRVTAKDFAVLLRGAADVLDVGSGRGWRR